MMMELIALDEQKLKHANRLACFNEIMNPLTSLGHSIPTCHINPYRTQLNIPTGVLLIIKGARRTILPK
jgi:hypothetical protein